MRMRPPGAAAARAGPPPPRANCSGAAGTAADAPAGLAPVPPASTDRPAAALPPATVSPVRPRPHPAHLPQVRLLVHYSPLEVAAAAAATSMAALTSPPPPARLSCRGSSVSQGAPMRQADRDRHAPQHRQEALARRHPSKAARRARSLAAAAAATTAAAAGPAAAAHLPRPGQRPAAPGAPGARARSCGRPRWSDAARRGSCNTCLQECICTASTGDRPCLQ